MQTQAYTYDRRLPLYHGTGSDFPALKLNENRILWLTHNPKVAEGYAQFRARSHTPYLWKIWLKPTAKVLDLSDLSDKTVRKLRDAINEYLPGSGRLTTHISEEDWPKWADFGLLEGIRWVRGWLKTRKVDAVTCSDALATTGVPHGSVALFSLSAIESAERVVLTNKGYANIPLGQLKTELDGWTPNPSDYR